MNKYLLGLVFLGVALIAGFYFLLPKTAVTNYPSEGTDIIAFGDSLIYGTGASEGRDFVTLLSRKTGKPIINLGVPGNTTEDGVARLSTLDRYNPKIVILLLGGNDRLRNVPRETTFSNLERIIENLHQRGAIVLLLGIRGSILNDQYRDKFDRLHEKYKTAYVPDVLEGLFGTREFMADQIHPNDAGYARIAERIAPVLEDLLK